MGDEMGYIAIHALAEYPLWQAEAALMATGEQMLKVATGENTDRPTTPHTYGIIARYLHRDSRGRGAAISPVLMNTGISLAPFFASGAPYAESALLLGQKLPGASGGYIHPEHLVEHLRPFMQALEDRIFAQRAGSEAKTSSATIRPTILTSGPISDLNESSFGVSWVKRTLKPVTLPPGRARAGDKSRLDRVVAYLKNNWNRRRCREALRWF